MFNQEYPNAFFHILIHMPKMTYANTLTNEELYNMNDISFRHDVLNPIQ